MRSSGILMALSSLPSDQGIGDLYESAYEFIDILKEANVKIWQLLPLNPVGYGNSPYQPYSSYAGDETCEESLPYCQSLSEEQGITQCIVFGSSFRSPRNGGGAWTANAEYTWTWYLAKGAAGDWVLLTYGYA